SPQDLLSRVRDLPALPDVYFQIRDLLEDRTSPLKLLAEVIGRDPGLSATLLKLVNSPLYGFPSRIDTLSRGITLVGTRELSKLAMGVTVIRMFQGVPEGLFTLRRFWEHSIACAVLSRIIDAQTGGDDLERSFLAGLLHDVGRLVMLLALPEVMAHVLHRANVEERLVCDLERETLGWDHGDMALVLLRSWKLPDSLVLSLACHHGLGATGPGPMRRAAGIINLADVVSAALGYATWELSPVPRLDPQGWDSLGLRPTQLAAIIAPARRQIRDVIASLLD
ncbi:MAG: HDOD domain-containing protein, partial [Desulfovibrionaceae bacterium]